MKLSELNFDDFYKFIMSAGILIIFAMVGISIYFSSTLLWFLTGIIFLLISTKLIYWAAKKWYGNQKLIDRKLKAECELLEKETSNINIPVSKKNKNVALIEYKVDSVLPGTVHFDLIKDEKVWFWIANLEGKQYLAYVKIKLKIGDYSKELDDKYYGGKEPWKLNAFTGIHAPGMPIPPEVIDKVKKEEVLDITVNCEIYDGNNKLIEKKLPVTFRYGFETKSWYLEP